MSVTDQTLFATDQPLSVTDKTLFAMNKTLFEPDKTLFEPDKPLFSARKGGLDPARRAPGLTPGPLLASIAAGPPVAGPAAATPNPADQTLSFPMAYLRVKLGFANAPGPVLEETAGHVLSGLYGNAEIYPAPPVTSLALLGALNHFTSTVSAQAQGGTQATAAKHEAAAALIGLLRQLALYVQTVIQANPAYGLAELLASGFEAVVTRHTQHPLAQPRIKEVMNSGTGRLTLKVGAVPNARAFEVRRQVAGGPWESAGSFNSTRGLTLTGLTPGTLYTVQVRAVGGSTGGSEWSDPVSHMSM